MMIFERSSLSQKLTISSVLSTATALSLVFIAFAVSSVLHQRQDMESQLRSFAGVIGITSVNPILFRDGKQAAHTLSALSAKPEIAAAALFDGRGKLLARYVAPGREADFPDQALSPEGAPVGSVDAATRLAQLGNAWANRMRVVRAVMHNEAVVGSVVIEADLSTLWRGIGDSLAVIGAAMAASLLLALFIALRFKNSITAPISKLINAAQKVSNSQNYTLRIDHQRSDELGALIDSFNHMLAQIEGRGAALTNHRDELERQVSVRTEQLEKAKNAAEAASRAKSAFLATMSHEIRTPMNGVLGMTEMLLSTSLTDTQRNYTSMVKRSGEHLLVIINDILDFSKIEAGKLTIEYIHFNLWDLLDDIDHAFMPQAQAKGIAFDFDIAHDIPVAVCGDPNRLRQIMANLIGNAIKFTEHGHITAKAHVSAEDAQSVTLRFEVHDTGIGISREARHRIFEAFSQADNSTTRKYGGTGLGLAISKQLVELMGGKIGVENALTQGSVFWFTVSFDKRRVEPDEPGAVPAAMEAIRALIVDEHADSRAQLRQQLHGWQIAADCAEHATGALDQLQAAARRGQPYDVAVIDMDLQRTSGLALAAAIRFDALTKNTRVLLLSAERCAADLVQRRQAGVAYQLIKPVRAGDLFECLVMRPRPKVEVAPAAAPLPRRVPRAADSRRRKVLLAEDNPVNVEVAVAMLDSLGLDTTCARNGEQALEAVRSAQFDVVLMDCQMPVMDGFAATAEIRRREAQAGHERSLPIIAITANALQGDRESCLAAGMDDYLSKPFTQHELSAVITRWIGVPLAATVHHDDRPPQVIESRDVINRQALDNIRALSRERGDALLQKVISAYVDDTPQHLQTLREAILGFDPNNLRKAAHSLKSSSANVGAETMAQMCKEMEQLGRTDSTEGASGILCNMEKEFQAVRHSLTALLEKET